MADRKAELRTAIEQTHNELVQALDALSADEMGKPSLNAGWTARDNMAHLSTIGRRHREQLECALSGQPYTNTEDVDTYNARMVAERKSWTAAQLKAEMEEELAATLAIIDRLQPGDLERSFVHPRRGEMNVDRILDSACTHLRTHLADVTGA